MPGGRMHADEVHTDADLVRRLVTAQFPHWAQLPIEQVSSAGTNNAIYRLGDDMVVRLPRVEDAVAQAEFEYRWLPRLASQIPLALPEPIALGTAGEGYPWPWAINRWIDGQTTSDENVDPYQLAIGLGEFVAGLRRADPAGAREGYRSGPLRARDAFVREWTAAAQGLIDTDAVIEVWEEALAAPEWDGPPVWTHGDLLAGNVLVNGGRLSGVIDFGASGVGDPACDAIAAWTLLTTGSRDVFRRLAGFDDAAWTRGRGWALTFVSALTYYRETNPAMVAVAERAIGEVLAERA